MKCPECEQYGTHADGCTWVSDIAPRYYPVLNAVLAFGNSQKVEKLREAQELLFVLIAWAAAREPSAPLDDQGEPQRAG